MTDRHSSTTLPWITPERYQRVKALADAAAQLQPSEREAFIQAASAGDSRLSEEVDQLMAARAELDEPGDAGPATTVTSPMLSDDDAPPQHVGPYRLLRRLGKGGMGDVFLALRHEDGFERHVAVKLPRRGSRDPNVARRFLIERQVLARLDHPHIIHLLDVGRSDECGPYMVMEYVDGLPIHRYCDRTRTMVPDRVRLFLKVCQAVHFAHERRIVHRDLKPNNILVSAEGVPKLIDFGIAQTMTAGGDGEGALTETGQIAGTKGFVPPELWQGEPVDVSSDIFGLGVVFYHLLTGRYPDNDSSCAPPTGLEAGWEPVRVLPTRPSHHFRVPWRLPRRSSSGLDETGAAAAAAARGGSCRLLRSTLAGRLDRIALRMLHPDAPLRYADVGQVIEDLQAFLDERSGLPVAPVAAERRAGRVMPVLLVIGLAAIAITGTFLADRFAAAESSPGPILSPVAAPPAPRIAPARVSMTAASPALEPDAPEDRVTAAEPARAARDGSAARKPRPAAAPRVPMFARPFAVTPPEASDPVASIPRGTPSWRLSQCDDPAHLARLAQRTRGPEAAYALAESVADCQEAEGIGTQSNDVPKTTRIPR